MSTAIMGQCWPLQMPPTPKAVLISLADNANDRGECYPSVATICERTCLAERTVQDAIRWLEENCALDRQLKPGRSTVYLLTPGRYQPPQQPHPRSSRTPAAAAPHPRSSRTPTPAAAAPGGAAAAPITVIEPSVEPSRNQKTRAAPAAASCPDDVPPDVWADWLRVRRAKRGGEVTPTALAGMRREADRAGVSLADAVRLCCERSWIAFRADWLQPRGGAPPSRASPTAADRRAETVARLTGGLMGKPPPDPRTIVDVEPAEPAAPRLTAAGR